MALVMVKRGRNLLWYAPLSAATTCIGLSFRHGNAEQLQDLCAAFARLGFPLFIGIFIELGAMLLEPAADDVRVIVRVAPATVFVKHGLAAVRGDPMEKQFRRIRMRRVFQ